MKEDSCSTLSCPRPVAVLLIVTHADSDRRVRAYCAECVVEIRKTFPDRIVDEITPL